LCSFPSSFLLSILAVSVCLRALYWEVLSTTLSQVLSEPLKWGERRGKRRKVPRERVDTEPGGKLTPIGHWMSLHHDLALKGQHLSEQKKLTG
jgi:hypothetical protein